jgi:ankyrin repeat protein
MAIGGAGHPGRRDIAEYLLSRGSRMDIFVATMLGQLDIIKATLTAYPSLITSRGPHGLTLSHYAEKGGEQARAVLEYLRSAGAGAR